MHWLAVSVSMLSYRAKPHKFSHLISFLAHKVWRKLDLGRDRGIDVAEECPTLEYTPTWVVAVVIVVNSLAVVRVLHYTGKACYYLNLTLFFSATIISISLVCVWIQVCVFPFLFSFFGFSRSYWPSQQWTVTVHCSRVLQTSLFSNFFIKNWLYGTIHTFKNYFATMFLVFNFQFQQNKFYLNIS